MACVITNHFAANGEGLRGNAFQPAGA